jgi:hypothetical protein
MPAIQTKGFTNPPSLSSTSTPPKIRKPNATTTRQSQPSPQKHLRKAYPSRPAAYALRVYRLLPRSHQTLKVGNIGMAPKRKPCKPGDGHVGQMSRSPWAISHGSRSRADPKSAAENLPFAQRRLTTTTRTICKEGHRIAASTSSPPLAVQGTTGECWAPLLSSLPCFVDPETTSPAHQRMAQRDEVAGHCQPISSK